MRYDFSVTLLRETRTTPVRFMCRWIAGRDAHSCEYTHRWWNITTSSYLFAFKLFSSKLTCNPFPVQHVCERSELVRLEFISRCFCLLCYIFSQTAKFNTNPLCLLWSQGTFIFSIVKYSPLKFSNTYVYPLWANILGWFIATVSLSLIPLFVLYKLKHGEGTVRQVSMVCLFLSELLK